MEDENGLELSLGLSLGGSAGKSKVRDAPLEPKVEESSSKGCLGASDSHFVHFFQTNAENQEHNSKQRQEPVTPPFGNFWRELGTSSPSVRDGTIDPMNRQPHLPRYQDGWISKNKGNSSEEEKPGLSKRKLLPEEISFHRKHHRVADQGEELSKISDGGAKNAPISISTDDGSTGENEDVAESEAEGSNSWLVAQREDSAKGSVVNRETDKKGSTDPAAVGFQGQKQPSFSGSESSSGKMACGTPLSFQASNVVAVPYLVPGQVSAAPSITNAASFPPTCAVQLRPPTTSSNGAVVQAATGANSHMAFGYSTVQLPTLETSSSWAFASPPQIMSSFNVQDKEEGAGNQHAGDDAKKSQGAGASSSARVEDEKKADKSIAEGFSLVGSAIRPGIAPNIKFGGSGSYPDLPWVSATGSGPNGRTISGVTYKFGKGELKVVCACHGTHMSLEEFVQHASVDAPSQENSTALPTFSVGNQATSAQN